MQNTVIQSLKSHEDKISLIQVKAFIYSLQSIIILKQPPCISGMDKQLQVTVFHGM